MTYLIFTEKTFEEQWPLDREDELIAKLAIHYEVNFSDIDLSKEVWIVKITK